MKQFKGLTKWQNSWLIILSSVSILAIFFIIACICCTVARADSDDMYYLANRDTSLDRVVGDGVRIGPSQYFSRGISVSTGPESLGSVTIVAVVNDLNAVTLEISFETKGKGKAFIVKNDITEKTGEVMGDTHDLFYTKPKVFYLYPASEYLNSEGQLEISIGAQEGDTLDVNYVRVRALDYRPLSTRQQARIVYDYPPTYVSSAPSIWFAIYRGPYYDYFAGYYSAYYDWWNRPEYYNWYRPYYQRVIVPVYNQYNYFFYNERHHQGRGDGDHYRRDNHSDRGRYGDDARKGGPRLTDRVRKDEVMSKGNGGASDRGNSYRAPKEKTRSGSGSVLDVRRGVGARFSETKGNGEVKDSENILNLKRSFRGGDVVRAKQNLNRRAEQQQGSRIQREPEQRLTGLKLDRNGATPDTRANNLRSNPSEKIRRDEPRQSVQQQVQREQPVRAVQLEKVVQQQPQNRPEKRMPEQRQRVEQQKAQPQPKVESRSPAPPKDDEDKNQKQKHRR